MSMKTAIGSPWFVAVGASAVLLIGALAHFDPVAPASPTFPPSATIIAEEKFVPESEAGPPLPADSSPSMFEVIRLAESHVDSGVILAFIQNSGQTYSPTADDILYLSRLNVPQNVIAALFPRPLPQPAAIAETAPAEVPDAPPQDANSNVFAEALAPYGNWVQVPDYGAAWQPAVETANPDWRPYVDGGQWIDSDSGWYWQSEYAWGGVPFHYGGWVSAPQFGWVWVPGRTWAPAWVSWRASQSYVGWAALPPGVSLNVLSQLAFNGHPVSYGYDFGLAPSAYTFVRASRFLNTDLPRHVVPAGRAVTLVVSSTVINNYIVVNNKIINEGVGRAKIAAAVKHPVPVSPAAPAPDLVQAPPGLLASARPLDPVVPGMQLPPLRYGAPPGVVYKHEYSRGFEAQPSERPVFRDSMPAPQSRSRPEERVMPPAPVRNVAPVAPSAGKATK
jgi:hypothetical protein